MIPKTSFSWINYAFGARDLLSQENIAAASLVDQMPLPQDSDDVFFDAHEYVDSEGSEDDVFIDIEQEISQEEADILDAEADAIDAETEASLNHPFAKAIINMLAVPTMPVTAGISIATYLAEHHPRSLRVGLAMMEATNIITTPLKAWQDVKRAKKLIDPQKEQQGKHRHKRSLDDTAQDTENLTTSSQPSFSEGYLNGTASAIHKPAQDKPFIETKGHRLVGDCLKDFYYSNSSSSHTKHKLFHTCCTPTELQIKDECLTPNSQASAYHFSRYGDDLSLTTVNSAECSQPFIEQSKDPKLIFCLVESLNDNGCLLHYARPNANGSETHKLFNTCNNAVSVIFEADCSSNGKQQSFHLSTFGDTSFFVKNKSKCKRPISTSTIVSAIDNSSSAISLTQFTTTTKATTETVTQEPEIGIDPAIREDILKVLSSPKSTYSFKPDTYPVCEAIEYAELSEYAYCCERAHLPNHLNVRELSRGWSLNSNLTQRIAKGLKGEYFSDTGLLQTKEGLVCAVVEKEGETCVLFGGTYSVAEDELNTNISSAQWKANALMATGTEVPIIYLQAATAAETVKHAIGDKPLCTVGHSLGGGLANFAAAMAGTPDSPVKAYGFCSAQINHPAKEMIANKCKTPEEATSLVSEIRNVAISGDPVSAGSFFNSDLNVLGQRVDIKQAPSTEGGWQRYIGLDVDYAHNAYLQHIQAQSNTDICFDPNKCTEIIAVIFSLTEAEYIAAHEIDHPYMGREPKSVISFKNRCHKTVDVGLSTVCSNDEVRLSFPENSGVVSVEHRTCLELQRKGKRGIKFNNRYKD